MGKQDFNKNSGEGKNNLPEGGKGPGNDQPGNNQSGNGGPGKFFKNPFLYIIMGSLALSMLLNRPKEEGPTELDYSDFLDKVKTEQVDNITISDREVRGDLYQESDTLSFESYVPERENVVERLVESDVTYRAEKPQKGSNWGLVVNLLFLGGMGVVTYILFKAMFSKGGNSIGGMNKSLAKEAENVTITFDDVAGADEAKKDLKEIVEFLKSPERFSKVGAKMPRGVLMEGPPGTGKTLMAKAVAGEAGAPFLSVSGSAFVEMYVGRGAARVRDMFKKARDLSKKTNGPVIIFIDEIDAVGGKRGQAGGNNNDEREQTLNEILTQMDGMEERDNIVVIAATNRADMLDGALTRAGRFDRKVTVGLPDVRGRRRILDVHANKKRKAAKKEIFGTDINWDVVAAATPGFSGADLENLINEATIYAARRESDKVEQVDMEEARDKILMGARSSTAVSEKRKELVAWHEAAHTVVAYELREHASPIHKVTLIPRGHAAGALFHLPRESEIHSIAHLKADMAVAMAGRMGEEALYGEGSELVTAGAQSDIQQATDVAEKMVTAWGMSDVTGMRNYRSNPGMPSPSRAFGTAVGDQVDQEVNKLLEGAAKTAREILKKREPQLKALVKALYEYETLDASEVDKVMKGLPIGRLPTEDPSNDNNQQANNNKKPKQNPPKKGLG